MDWGEKSTNYLCVNSTNGTDSVYFSAYLSCMWCTAVESLAVWRVTLETTLILQIFKFFLVLTELGLHPAHAYACAQLCACYLVKAEHAYQPVGHRDHYRVIWYAFWDWLKNRNMSFFFYKSFSEFHSFYTVSEM